MNNTPQWITAICAALGFIYIVYKGRHEVKHFNADTKNKELDSRIKELQLADLTKKDTANSQDSSILDQPKYEPLSHGTWWGFLGFGFLNVLAFLFIAFTQTLTTLNVGLTVLSISVAVLSITVPILATFWRSVSYSNAVQNYIATRLFYAHLQLATSQFQVANTVGALAKGQFNLANDLLQPHLNELQQRLVELKNKTAEVDLHVLNQPIPGLVERLQRSVNEVGVHLETIRQHTSQRPSAAEPPK
jgi:hypothetical protein